MNYMNYSKQADSIQNKHAEALVFVPWWLESLCSLIPGRLAHMLQLVPFFPVSGKVCQGRLKAKASVPKSQQPHAKTLHLFFTLHSKLLAISGSLPHGHFGDPSFFHLSSTQRPPWTLNSWSAGQSKRSCKQAPLFELYLTSVCIPQW